MLSNSEFIVMLNQAASDREKLADKLNISEEQLGYITNAEAGCGLIRYGSALVPFKNRFPKNTELYRLMTTKPGEDLEGGSVNGYKRDKALRHSRNQRTVAGVGGSAEIRSLSVIAMRCQLSRKGELFCFAGQHPPAHAVSSSCIG